MRAFGGIVAGLLIGFVVAIAFTIVSIVIHPLPAGFNAKSQADLSAYYMNAPFTALGVIVLGRFLGALAGGWTANAIALARWPAWVIGVVLSLYLLVEMSSIPHPQWMQITGLLAPLVGAAIAHHFAGRRRDAEAADEEETPRDGEISQL